MFKRVLFGVNVFDKDRNRLLQVWSRGKCSLCSVRYDEICMVPTKNISDILDYFTGMDMAQQDS